MRNIDVIYERRKAQTERHNQIIAVWKIVVGVQQHFNDISMRIRSMFVTILLALFASIGFLLDKKLDLQVVALKIEFTVLVPLFGIIGTCLFYFIDRYWYHRLLVGAVRHAITIEKRYQAELPELSLSAAIGKESPYTPTGVVRLLANLLVTHDPYRNEGQLHSDGKIELFYKGVMLLLFIIAFLLAVFGGVTVRDKTFSAWISSIATSQPNAASVVSKAPQSAPIPPPVHNPAVSPRSATSGEH